MLGKVVLFLCFLAVASSQSTAISQCIANPGELPINTYIEGCTTPPCLLPQLQDVVLHIVFRAPRTMRSMRTLATAYMSFIIGPPLPIPYDLGQNAVTCNFLTNSFCPVIQGEVLQYTLRMFIEPFFPVNTQVTLEFRVVDENNGAVICIRVPIRIDPPVGGSRLSNGTLSEDHK